MPNRKQWKARAVCGGADKRQLVLARQLGQSIVVRLGKEEVEITLVAIAENSVAIMLETAERNLIMRKELIDV